MKSVPESEKAIWDIPTRVLHWTLAICVVLNLFILNEGKLAHRWTGYIAVSAVVLRLLWSFFSAPASRLSALPISRRDLSSFIRRKWVTLGVTLGAAPGGNPDELYIGHSPLASLVYVGIWLLIFGLGITGWMMRLDAFWGEDWLEEIHGNIAFFLELLILAHLAGIAHDSIRHRRPTWMAMFTGHRRAVFSDSDKDRTF